MIVITPHISAFKALLVRWHLLPTQQICIPQTWEELTPTQYIAIIKQIAAINQYYTIHDLRLRILQELTGYTRSKKKRDAESIETINSNLVILADKLQFPIKPSYTNPAVLEVLSHDLQKELQNKFPYDIMDIDHRTQLSMVQGMLQYTPVVNLNMKRNPIPSFIHDKQTYTGIEFTINADGVEHTNITVSQYLDACDFSQHYADTKNPEYLCGLVATLYSNATTTYQRQTLAFNLYNANAWLLFGVYTYFQSITQFFATHSVYGMLFNGGESESNKINLGMEGIIDTLVHDGYGQRSEIMQSDIVKYFNLLIKQISDAVRSMRANNIEEHKIADNLNISLEKLAML